VFLGAHARIALILTAAVVLFATGKSYAAEKPKATPQPTTLSLNYELVEPAAEPAKTNNNPAGLESTLENPFAHRKAVSQPPIPAVVIKARLSDSASNPIAFKPVAFSVKTFFGTLPLGSRPTGADGVAKIKVSDRRFGTYTIQASFAGDDENAASTTLTGITNTPRPAPALPPQGMLITPYPTLGISAPFVFFFGMMWGVFAYVSYILWRVQRLGRAAEHID
jgi:hypothetical protein